MASNSLITEVLVEARDVNFSYASLPAVVDVSLSLPRGALGGVPLTAMLTLGSAQEALTRAWPALQANEGQGSERCCTLRSSAPAGAASERQQHDAGGH